MRLRGLVIGLGDIGLNYDLDLDHKNFILTHSSSLFTHPDYELVGGCDIKDEQREKFKKYYNKTAYSKIESAIKDTSPEIVCISVPTKDHYVTVKEIFKYFKPLIILCEKPISNSFIEAQELDQICKDHDCELFVNYMRRSEQGCIEIKKRITESSIKGPFKGTCYYSKGLKHNGSHFINLLQYWLGEIISYKVINKGNTLKNGDIEPDFLVNFKNGEVVFLALDENNFSHYTIELIGLNGRLKYELDGKISWQEIIKDKVYKDYKVIDHEKTYLENNINFAQYNVLDEIIKQTKKSNANICSSKDAMNTLSFISNIVKEL